MDESVKQFSMERWAKLKAMIRDGEGGTVEGYIYILPGDILRLETDGTVSRVLVSDGEYSMDYVVLSTVEEIEQECNRALASLEKDIEKAATSEFIKRGMFNKLGIKQETN